MHGTLFGSMGVHRSQSSVEFDRRNDRFWGLGETGVGSRLHMGHGAWGMGHGGI